MSTLSAASNCCEEASTLSTNFYIPCNRPAKFFVTNKDGEKLRMCEICAHHNVKNRGAKFAGDFVADGVEIEDGALLEALKDSTDSGLVVKDNSIKTISTLAFRQLSLQAQVEQAELALENLNKQLKQVSEVDLPNAMLEVGMREFKLTDGSSVKVEKVYGASIKVEFRQEAYKWLIDHGHAGLIKTAVAVEFGKGMEEREQAVKFKEDLVADGFDAKLEESVHAQTLKAFAREQIEAGETLPETITTFVGERAKIVLPKKKKSSLD